MKRNNLDIELANFAVTLNFQIDLKKSRDRRLICPICPSFSQQTIYCKFRNLCLRGNIRSVQFELN